MNLDLKFFVLFGLLISVVHCQVPGLSLGNTGATAATGMGRGAATRGRGQTRTPSVLQRLMSNPFFRTRIMLGGGDLLHDLIECGTRGALYGRIMGARLGNMIDYNCSMRQFRR